MPLDVLKQLQEASSNVDNQQLKQSLENVIQKAGESSESMSVLKSIMSALTQGGQELSDSLEKVVYYFERVEQRSNAAKSAMMGLGNSFNSMDYKPLQQIGAILERIQSQQQTLSQKIDMIPGAENAYKQLQKVYSELSQIQKIASKGVDINVNYSGSPKIQKTTIQGQSFSQGGSVRHSYKPINTQKAKTGGQFTGKRSGDREIAFVNAGQAIITEKAIKSGARQVGMSVGSYINSLNSGNLSRIKKGRSFDKGTTGKVDDVNYEDVSNLQEKLRKGWIESDKSSSEIKGFLGKLEKHLQSDQSNKGVEGLFDKLSKMDKKQQRKAMGYIQKSAGLSGVDLDTSKFEDIIPILERINDEFDQIGDISDESQRKIQTFGDAIEASLQDASDQIERAAKKLGNFGHLLIDNGSKAGYFVAGMVKLSQQVQKASKEILDFSAKQTELNKKLADFNSTGNLFGNVDMTKFKDEMNLTREQASQLSATFRTVGIEGNVSFGQIETLAKGIKDQFGQLDTSLLQQAIKQVKDLPKQQIDVLINGTGSVNDQFNLIANLMKDDAKLNATAQIIAKGGFGQVKGVTPKLSQGDREKLQIHAETNKKLDDLNAFFNNMIPAWLVSVSGIVTLLGTFAGMFGTMIGSLGAIGTTVSAIATNTGAGGLLKNIKDGGLKNLVPPKGIEKVSGVLGKTAGKVVGVVGGTVGKIVGVVAGGISKIATAITGPVGLAVAAIIAVCAIWDKLAKKRVDSLNKEAQKKIKERKQHNKQVYGVSVNDQKVSTLNTLTRATIDATNKLYNPLVGIKNLFSDLKAIIIDLQNPLDVIKRRFRDTFSVLYQDNRRNRIASAGAITIKAAKRAKRVRDEIYERAGIKDESNINVKKQILLLSSINKRVKMVADGAYSESNRMLAQSATSKNNMISQIGGTDYNFRFNASDAIHNASEGVAQDLSRLQENMKETFKKQKSGELSSNAVQSQVTKIVSAQVKVYERLTKVLNENIAQYEKMPSVIQASLVASLNNTVNKSKNARFTGSIGSNAFSADKILKAASEANQSVLKKAIADLESVQKMVKTAQDNINTARAMVVSTVDNSNGTFQRVSNPDGSFDEKAHESNLEAATKIWQEYENKLNEASRSGKALQSKNASSQIQTQISEVQGLGESTSKMSRQELKDEAGEELIKQYQRSSNFAIETLQNALANASSLEEKQEINDFIAKINQSVKNIREYQGSGDVSNMVEQSGVLQETLQSATDYFKQQQKNYAMSDAGFRSYFDSQGKKIGKAKQYMQASRAMSGATNAKNLQENQINKIITQSIKSYEDSAQKFQEAIDLIYNSSQVLYQKMRSQVAEKSYGYDSAGDSRRAIDEVFNSEFRKLSVRKKALDSAGDVVNQAQIVSQNFINSGLKEILQKNNVSQEDAEFYSRYAELQHNAGLLMSKNPQDEEGKRALEEALLKLNKFREDNKEKIDANDPITKAIDGSVGNFFTIIQKQTKEMVQWKNDFIKELSDVGQKLINNLKNNLNVTLAQAKTEQMLSVVQVHEANVDFSGMRQAAKQASVLIGKGLQTQLKELSVGYDVTKANIEASRAESLKSATSQEDRLAIEATYQKAMSDLNEKYNRERVAATEKAGKKIQEAYQAQMEAIGRRTEGLQIQKDLFNSIGAPFEMILEIEQGIVQAKRQEALIEQNTLQDMIKRGANHIDIEKQKLKTAKAQADVLKSAFGAQRDSLDKMLGKMMGTFDQVGGIFGPDGERMLARKYGQGYSWNEQTNMVHVSGPNAHNSHQERVLANAQTAAGSGAVGRMMNGHMMPNQNWFNRENDNASKPWNNAQDVISGRRPTDAQGIDQAKETAHQNIMNAHKQSFLTEQSTLQDMIKSGASAEKIEEQKRKISQIKEAAAKIEQNREHQRTVEAGETMSVKTIIAQKIEIMGTDVFAKSSTSSSQQTTKSSAPPVAQQKEKEKGDIKDKEGVKDAKEGQVSTEQDGAKKQNQQILTDKQKAYKDQGVETIGNVKDAQIDAGGKKTTDSEKAVIKMDENASATDKMIANTLLDMHNNVYVVGKTIEGMYKFLKEKLIVPENETPTAGKSSNIPSKENKENQEKSYGWKESGTDIWDKLNYLFNPFARITADVKTIATTIMDHEKPFSESVSSLISQIKVDKIIANQIIGSGSESSIKDQAAASQSQKPTVAPQTTIGLPLDNQPKPEVPSGQTSTVQQGQSTILPPSKPTVDKQQTGEQKTANKPQAVTSQAKVNFDYDTLINQSLSQLRKRQVAELEGKVRRIKRKRHALSSYLSLEGMIPESLGTPKTVQELHEAAFANKDGAQQKLEELMQFDKLRFKLVMEKEGLSTKEAGRMQDLRKQLGMDDISLVGKEYLERFEKIKDEQSLILQIARFGSAGSLDSQKIDELTTQINGLQGQKPLQQFVAKKYEPYEDDDGTMKDYFSNQTIGFQQMLDLRQEDIRRNKDGFSDSERMARLFYTNGNLDTAESIKSIDEANPQLKQAFDYLAYQQIYQNGNENDRKIAREQMTAIRNDKDLTPESRAVISRAVSALIDSNQPDQVKKSRMMSRRTEMAQQDARYSYENLGGIEKSKLGEIEIGIEDKKVLAYLQSISKGTGNASDLYMQLNDEQRKIADMRLRRFQSSNKGNIGNYIYRQRRANAFAVGYDRMKPQGVAAHERYDSPEERKERQQTLNKSITADVREQHEKEMSTLSSYERRISEILGFADEQLVRDDEGNQRYKLKINDKDKYQSYVDSLKEKRFQQVLQNTGVSQDILSTFGIKSAKDFENMDFFNQQDFLNQLTDNQRSKFNGMVEYFNRFQLNWDNIGLFQFDDQLLQQLDQAKSSKSTMDKLFSTDRQKLQQQYTDFVTAPSNGHRAGIFDKARRQALTLAKERAQQEGKTFDQKEWIQGQGKMYSNMESYNHWLRQWYKIQAQAQAQTSAPEASAAQRAAQEEASPAQDKAQSQGTAQTQTGDNKPSSQEVGGSSSSSTEKTQESSGTADTSTEGKLIAPKGGAKGLIPALDAARQQVASKQPSPVSPPPPTTQGATIPQPQTSVASSIANASLTINRASIKIEGIQLTSANANRASINPTNASVAAGKNQQKVPVVNGKTNESNTNVNQQHTITIKVEVNKNGLEGLLSASAPQIVKIGGNAIKPGN